MPKDLVFLDTETTGLDTAIHDMLEVALIRTTPDGERVYSRWSAKIWPTPEMLKRASPEALAVNHFHERWVEAECVEPSIVAAEMSLLTKDAHLVGWNLPFDVGFMEKFLGRKGPWDWYMIDLKQAIYPHIIGGNYTGRNKLEHVVNALGIPWKQAHTALGDAEMTYEVWRRLKNHAAANRIWK